MKSYLIIMLLSLFFVAPVVAGPGHEDGHGHSHSQGPVSGDEAAKRAAKKVKQLADTGKIDESWSGISASTTEQKTYAKGPEWLVTFKNDKVTDSSKQTLFLFYTLDGHYIAANYTGN